MCPDVSTVVEREPPEPSYAVVLAFPRIGEVRRRARRIRRVRIGVGVAGSAVLSAAVVGWWRRLVVTRHG